MKLHISKRGDDVFYAGGHPVLASLLTEHQARRHPYVKAGWHDLDDELFQDGMGNPVPPEEMLSGMGLRVRREPEPVAMAEGQEPVYIVDRSALIMVAVRGLDPDNTALWTNGGVPQVAAIESVTKLDDVSATERDIAWAAVQAERAG